MSFTEIAPASERLARSELVVPGATPALFEKAARSAADAVILDLEDAVAMVVRTVEEQTAEDWSRAYDAHGVDDPTRFSIILRCAAHFHHHLGQIIYLVKEHARQRV